MEALGFIAFILAVILFVENKKLKERMDAVEMKMGVEMNEDTEKKEEEQTPKT